jgi:multidrug efflux pump subunit AcrA (membrane-fusion protein)
MSAAPQPPNGGERHVPPPGADLMNMLRWLLFAGLLVLAVVTIGSYVMSSREGARPRPTTGTVVWRCPMHPSYTSDKPGECPICGMTLEKVVLGDTTATAVQDAGNVPGLISVHITPERIQRIGVRTARVVRSAASGELELVGFVTADETRLRRVQIRASGWVRRLFVNATGGRVETGDPLLTIYSPELLQSEQEFLIARGAADSMPGMTHGDAGSADAGSAAADRLLRLGIPAAEIRRLAREGKATSEIVLGSPVSGTVIERNVVEGQFVEPETPLLTLADLSHVWVVADYYEMDMGRVREGDRARFTSDAMPGRVFEGRVDFVYPTVSSETRTLKARVGLANPDGALRPGMFGRVQVVGRAAPSLSVPSEAVVNTGDHTYVFLAHAGGNFEPRMVWTGSPEGDRVQVLKGVAEGDTVVASASFLIDSESRLKAAIAGMGGGSGMDHMPGMTHGAGQ